jgi:hypothetical protein
MIADELVPWAAMVAPPNLPWADSTAPDRGQRHPTGGIPPETTNGPAVVRPDPERTTAVAVTAISTTVKATTRKSLPLTVS